MDGQAAQDWKQEKKVAKLIGIKGHLLAARGMIRAERAKRRSSAKKSKGGTAPPQKRTVRCNVPWARCYVPGSPESGVKLVAGTEQSSLASPPGRCVWVARFKHPSLRAAGKRPTRSKTFRPGGVTEHVAFQLVLEWLWARHETCSGDLSVRPAWVRQALEPCLGCASPDSGVCDFSTIVQQARANTKDQPVAPETDNKNSGSSDWPGEGSSEDLSSDCPHTEPQGKVLGRKSKHPLQPRFHWTQVCQSSCWWGQGVRC